MASRLSSSCTQKTITGAGTSVLWVQTSAAQTSGEKASSSHVHEKHTLSQENINELKIPQLVCVITIPVLVSHHIPLLAVAALPGEAVKTLQQWATKGSNATTTKRLAFPDKQNSLPDDSSLLPAQD